MPFTGILSANDSRNKTRKTPKSRISGYLCTEIKENRKWQHSKSIITLNGKRTKLPPVSSAWTAERLTRMWTSSAIRLPRMTTPLTSVCIVTGVVSRRDGQYMTDYGQLAKRLPPRPRVIAHQWQLLSTWPHRKNVVGLTKMPTFAFIIRGCVRGL